MKVVLLSLCFLIHPLSAGLKPLGEHVDISFGFSAGEWTVGYETDTARFDLEEAFLPLADKAYVNGSPLLSGARHSQPSNAAFAFIGAAPGQSIWIAVQGTPGVGEAWPGFRNDQPEGTFGSYIPADTRVSRTLARPWIRVSLVDYQGPPGVNSHFSMWNTTSGQPPTVWMSTFDPSVENSYYFAAGSHTHVAMGFTAQGIHRVTLQASAFLGPGATNPTPLSEPFTLVFGVGATARWQGEEFDAGQLEDPAISALGADPDQDGLSNLLEYAFGTKPLAGGPVPAAEGLGMPVFSLVREGGVLYQTLTYPRRRAGTRILPEMYQPLFSESLNGDWSASGVTTVAGDFPVAQAALNERWERVVSRRPVPEGQTKGFGRLGVLAGDGLVP